MGERTPHLDPMQHAYGTYRKIYPALHQVFA